MSVSRPALLRQSATESSFSSLSRPGSVAHAIRRRIVLTNEPERHYASSTEKWTEFWPTVSRSPWFSCFSWTDSPLTNVPFVLPRSTTQNWSPRRSSRAWCPLVAGSRRITSLSGERPMRSAWSPARWLCPASGPFSIVSSACGPVPAAVGGRVGIAIVSGMAGGAAGGGCQAGISVVGSRSAPPPPEGGGATIVAATSIPDEGADQGAGAGLATSGSTGGASTGDCCAWAPAARSASVEAGAAGGAGGAAADHAGAGAFQGGGTASIGFAGSGEAGGAAAGAPHAGAAAGAPHAGAGGAAGCRVPGKAQAGAPR